LAQCLQGLPVLPADDDLFPLLVRALSEPWGRANELAGTAARVIKGDVTVKAALARLARAWPQRLALDELLGAGGLAAVARHALLRCLLQAAPVADAELERLLTSLRAGLLAMAEAEAAAVDPELVAFACALARQCFLGEQAFALTGQELSAAQRLREEVAAAANARAAVPELRLAMLAAYVPLHDVPAAASLLELPWSQAMDCLLAQQLREPAQERKLRAEIPVLTAVDDPVSRAVRQQYEDNPYPRWERSAPAGPPMSFDQYLRRRLPAAAFHPLQRSGCDFLIAGCGTGQHAIETAQRFADSHVLAIDLSLASLGYAARKSRELGCRNLELAQADLLRLAELGRRFDVIECSGVLHHLADPFAGWRALLSQLRPGGFMMVGLYSEIARAPIVAARAFIAERGYGSAADDIRRCRQDILAQGLFKDIVSSADFFSLSGCRDLLLHVQEHRLTLPQIADFLAASGLGFLGFELEAATRRRYLEQHPQDAAMTDLARWDRFEREHPRTFAGMYQFWVQKPP